MIALSLSSFEQDSLRSRGLIFLLPLLLVTPLYCTGPDSPPSANKSRSRKRDGVLGYGFFRRFVVEIDHQAKTIRLHDPASYTYAGQGEKIPLRFRNTTPIVTAEIKRPGRASISGQFEIDTG